MKQACIGKAIVRSGKSGAEAFGNSGFSRPDDQGVTAVTIHLGERADEIADVGSNPEIANPADVDNDVTHCSIV